MTWPGVANGGNPCFGVQEAERLQSFYTPALPMCSESLQLINIQRDVV